MENKKQEKNEFAILRKQLNEDWGDHTEKITKRIENSFQKYTGILYEKFRDDVKQVAELTLGVKEKVDKMEGKLDATFEMTGKLATDVEIMKGDMGIMKRDIEITKQDINFIKHGLKKKVDVEEFAVLERRVAIIEAKFTPRQI